MVRWLARILLLKVLPKRLVPILTVVEIARLARSVSKRRRGIAVNEPSASRTARPPRPPGSGNVVSR
jgi:hypothetical protein